MGGWAVWAEGWSVDWCPVVHHLLRFRADFLGVFWVAEGASGLGGAASMSLWWCGPFRSYGALKAQKTADITTC